MKKATIIIALAAAVLCGCSTQKPAAQDPRFEISWQAFCAARGYDPDDNTYSAINEYLDAWRGSVEEDSALINAGCEPL